MTETKKVTDLAGEIATASQEQSEGINQISKAVSTMDTVTQQNAANAEELAASSEELTAQAESLKTIVGELAAQVGDIDTDLDASESAKSQSSKKDHYPNKETITQIAKPAHRGTKDMKYPVVKSNGNGSKKKKLVSADTHENLIPLSSDFKDF